jgi:uncharacterized protein (DUF169 family)
MVLLQSHTIIPSMSDYAGMEASLRNSLQLKRRPVAIAFMDTAPAGVPKLTGSQPSGCSFWSLAADGKPFYTVPADHYNCPIGSYTHNIPLPSERQHELTDTLGLMAEIGYLRMQEVPAVPQLPRTPPITLYSPLAETPVAPDAVIVSGTPGHLMLLHEAATRIGTPAPALLGRPTCMAIPAAMATGVASSLGCVGNRVYTGVADDEFYTVVRGDRLEALISEISTITAANVMLAEYHRTRRLALAT